MPSTVETGDILEIRDEHGGQVRHPLADRNLIIGRSSTADITLATATVSRRHAELVRDPFQRWWLRDLDSHNGTYINGERITETVLHGDDVVQIGEFTLQLIPATSESISAASRDMEAQAEVTAPAVQPQEDAGAVSALRQVEPAHVATEHLAKLADFGRMLISTEQSQQRLIDLCRLVIGENFHGQCALVLRLEKDQDPRQAQVISPAQHRVDGDGSSPHISRTLLRAVLREGEAMMATNTQPAATGNGNTDGERAGAIELSIAANVMAMAAIACPLHHDEQTMDVLYTTLPPEYANGEWLALVALAVRQYEQAELAWAGRRQAEALAAIERELDQARRLQTGLVPKQQQIAGLDTAIAFEPCRWVGGDYADILRTGDGRILVTVADVCGKGMQAALTTASIHTMVHTSVRAGAPIEQLMCHLNEHLLESLPDSSFVTMVCMTIDLQTGEVICVNAGHPPALVVDSAGTLRHMQEGENLPLGIAPINPEAQRDQLEPGHWLAMFSDGLTELSYEDGRMLGVKGLGEHFCSACKPDHTAQQITESMLAIANDIRGQRLAEDDWTLLVARRT